MNSPQFARDGWVAFLHALSSWLALLSCSTTSHRILVGNYLLSVRRSALLSPQAIRDAASGGRGLWVAERAAMSAAQVGSCPLIWSMPTETHPRTHRWLRPSALTALDFPGTRGRAHSMWSQGDSCLPQRFAGEGSQSTESLSCFVFVP